MLTPVEEAGLGGQRLAARVRRAFYQQSDAELAGLLDRVEHEAKTRRLVYLHDDVEEIIRLLPVPITALPGQLSYVRGVTLGLHNALRRLPDLYFADDDVRAVLRLPDVEEDWLRRYWT
ncbi:MAG: hypothetical protein KA190_20880, partial [Kofleriaceae bacterium]|nr:hypothetical protein [Kofleriaceae bacterium]